MKSLFEFTIVFAFAALFIGLMVLGFKYIPNWTICILTILGVIGFVFGATDAISTGSIAPYKWSNAKIYRDQQPFSFWFEVVSWYVAGVVLFIFLGFIIYLKIFRD